MVDFKVINGPSRTNSARPLQLACNANGSEKLPPLYIGRAKKPRLLWQAIPGATGLLLSKQQESVDDSRTFQGVSLDHYLIIPWANSLRRYIKKLDLKMRSQKRHILLTIDNFSGHLIDYVPTNIQIEFFEPNLTAFVQPLDAGIIRCFKAHYRNNFCQM